MAGKKVHKGEPIFPRLDIEKEIAELEAMTAEQMAKAKAKAAKDAGLADVVHAEDYQQAADALLARMAPGDALLVKASRGMALEKALALFYPVCTK